METFTNRNAIGLVCSACWLEKLVWFLAMEPT